MNNIATIITEKGWDKGKMCKLSEFVNHYQDRIIPFRPRLSFNEVQLAMLGPVEGLVVGDLVRAGFSFTRSACVTLIP